MTALGDSVMVTLPEHGHDKVAVLTSWKITMWVRRRLKHDWSSSKLKVHYIRLRPGGAETKRIGLALLDCGEGMEGLLGSLKNFLIFEEKLQIKSKLWSGVSNKPHMLKSGYQRTGDFWVDFPYSVLLFRGYPIVKRR